MQIPGSAHLQVFFYKDLVATTGVPDLPMKKKKKRKKEFIHTFAHTLLSAPEAVKPDKYFRPFDVIGPVSPKHPRYDLTALAESHLRRPTPFYTASKVCLGPHFINHTILTVILLHSFRSIHTPFASSNPISLSTRFPYPIHPPKWWPPSPPFSPHFQHIHVKRYLEQTEKKKRLPCSMILILQMN